MKVSCIMLSVSTLGVVTTILDSQDIITEIICPDL